MVLNQHTEALNASTFDEVEAVKRRLAERWGLKKIIGVTPAFVDAVKKIPRVAKSDVNVLIQGETGTGKEFFARAIHYLSHRDKGPFIPVNSATLPPGLFENELFGHAKEAFTDAKTARPGLVREAEGGTLFLDEINSIEPVCQAKLLRFLEDKAYRPLGSRKHIKAEVRIVSACNANLDQAVSACQFRADLYYRLNVVSLTLPPLRERAEDIPILVDHFLGKYRQRFGQKTFSSASMEILCRHPWPGNVRELENVVQRAMIMSVSDVIEPQVLPFSGPMDDSRGGENFTEAKKRAIETFERAYVSRMLLAYDGNITMAAKASGKDRRVFGRLVKKYGLSHIGRATSAMEEEITAYNPTFSIADQSYFH
jgi:transcriptional regulator with PAS, ATPase and Fis domain